MTIRDVRTPTHFIEESRIEKAVAEIIEAIHEDGDREGLAQTPARVAKMYGEIFAGLGEDPAELLSTGFDEGFDEMVAARDIQFFSMCEHHFLPFFGVAHVA